MVVFVLVAVGFGMVLEAALATRGWGVGAFLKWIRGR